MVMKEQTEMFWYLQLQFMSDRKNKQKFFRSVYFSNTYKHNRYSSRVSYMLHQFTPWSDDEFYHICTHFALQLAGVES
jgi:hypothetical protein